MPTIRFGGSFAPPITQDHLDRYRELAKTATDQVADAMNQLIVMVETFQQTPESTLDGTSHPSGSGTVTPLEEAEIKRIWDVVPWRDELDTFGERFEQIDPVSQKELRDAAHHLLWYGRELCLDREPITTDKL